jgi:antitoxin component YwqK of YwqJK toxin-antitoxin module
VKTETLNIAEIPFEGGPIQYRYARYLSDDGTRWVRHGRFCAYHPNGELASEGNYEHGSEHGPWKDFHDDGSLAATGQYERGSEVGDWHYFDKGMGKTQP